MTAISEVFAPLGLRVAAGPIELRGISDDDIVTLAELAVAGIHEPEEMPFFYPWTDAPAAELPLRFAQYHWRLRAEWSPESWELNLGVWHDGELVGVQGVSTRDFLVTRTGETGSWLGRAHQGRGLGTAMRQAMCALCFDHLGFAEITSGAFLDNPASLAVSRKAGYRANGVRRLARRPGELALNQGLVLSPGDFVRGEHALAVTGVDAFRRLIGLDSE
ncbi:GNAT family N-acetyltransferase [Nocardioides sp. LHG3406-4]|uniref:GNAT family N-acetyltransferase n=1 Tax=Nocardioides sp. LHG3406-4 TaxID=2804575 RepID=UPI003CEBF40E